LAWRWSKAKYVKALHRRGKWNCRKFYGQSGRVYFVTWSEETHWHAFIENAGGLVLTVAKTAAIDCGAIDDPKGNVFGSKERNIDLLWQQIWKRKSKYMDEVIVDYVLR
jgi:hypothetical protein